MTVAEPAFEMLILSPELAGTLMSPDEFDSVEDWDDDYTYELINGVLVVTPPVSDRERGPNDELGYLLRTYRDNHPKGHCLDFTLFESLVCTPNNRRRADRVIWVGLGRTPNPTRDIPTIAVEFVSEGKRNRRRDYLAKREEYMATGVREYWIFDRFRRILTVVRPNEPDVIVKETETYRTPLLPGFELPLHKLLSVADSLEQAASDD